MERTVNGKRYNTETATLVATDSYSYYGDLERWIEELYRTQKGNWFLYGEGSARSPYAKCIGKNQAIGSSAITPFSAKEALAWLDDHTENSGAYEEYFINVLEDA